MGFAVMLTDAAACDLDEIYSTISLHDSPQKADHVIERIEKVFSSLSEYPERGVHPKELRAIGIRDYREIFFKPYRVIYRILDNTVYVLLIVDGRRDMQSLLQWRLLNA